MSHIFDALQRSESERSGIELDASDMPTELLQMAESAKLAEVVRADAAQTPAAPEGLVAGIEAASQGPAPVNAFPQFESLPVSLLRESKLVSSTEKEGLAAEKFRYLAVRLRHLQQKKALKKLLITSTVPEEGKSMVAANLACTLAGRRQQPTLLLEGDLRRPTFSHQFGLGKIRGLSEYLQDPSASSIPVYRLDALGMWILAAGNSQQNPMELMQSGRLSLLMDQLSTWFDWIVIDSPPVLPLGDTSIWTRVSDGILLVTRQGRTERQQLQKGIEAIEPSKLIGALVNSSREATHAYYGNYYKPTE